MSYLVLARKWRPQCFADLVGQEHVSRTLANAITSGRVHHAFLFTGARGVGKTSAARILAKALTCEQPDGVEPCNNCSACRQITAGTSVDVFEIDGASNNGVDDIRDLRETLRYLPTQLRCKIYIIDEVHMLSVSAFNALLKTLEEPPEHVKFIFATTEPHKIPVTILSRCQRFDFNKIPTAKVVAQLRRIVEAENIAVSERALTMLAQRGGGSMRDCLSTLDQIVAFCGENVADEDVQRLLGLVDQCLLLDVLSACMERDCTKVLELVQQVDDLGYSFRQFCHQLVEMVRRIILCGVVADPREVLGLFEEDVTACRSLGQLASQDDWQRLLTMLLKTGQDLAHATFPRLLVEMTLVRAATLPPGRDIAELIGKLEDLQTGLPPVAAAGTAAAHADSVAGDTAFPCPAPPPQSDTAPPAAAKSTSQLAPAPEVATAVADSAVDDQQQWRDFVVHVQSGMPRVGAVLEHGSLLELAPPLLKIGFAPGSFHLRQLSDKNTIERLNEAARQFFGQPMQLQLEALQGSKKAPLSLVAAKKKQETDRERRLRADALAHPLVNRAVEIFSGQVVEVIPLDKGYV